jgi:hypothetical protein
MADLEAFMSDFLSQYDCSSINVVSDNARVPQQQQQQQQQQVAPSSPVSPGLIDYKRTTRWGSPEATATTMGPPVRQISGDGLDLFSPAGESTFSQERLRFSSDRELHGPQF